MESDKYLEHVRSDGDALVAAARRAPDATVDNCPGWSMADLLGHTGGVYRWVAETVRTKATERLHRKNVGEVPGTIDTVVPWFEAGLDDLLAVLGATSPDAAVWTWFDGQSGRAGWWFRRMAQETVIHRCDGEAAAGLAPDIEPALAVDGIDEFLTFVTRDESTPGFEGELSLVATDVEASWHLGLAPDRIEKRDPAGGGDLVRGTASDLYLWLHHREPQNAGVVGEGKAAWAWEHIKFE